MTEFDPKADVRWERMLQDGSIFHKRKKKKTVPVAFTPSAIPVADTHGHLTLSSELSPAQALARGALAGLRMLVAPIDPAEMADAQALLDDIERWVEEAQGCLEEAAAAGLFPPEQPGFEDVPSLPEAVYLVCGAHPYHARELDEGFWDRMKTLMGSPRAIGVGEIGLDYTSEIDRTVQIRTFAEQYRYALELDVPVELHLRDAADDPDALAHRDALELLDELGIAPKGVDLHCYTSTPEVMAPYVERGCYVAFGGAATFKKSEEIRDAFLACPDPLVLTETDAPYMAPEPLRGRECEPAMAVITAQTLSELKAPEGPESALRVFWENARRFTGR